MKTHHAILSVLVLIMTVYGAFAAVPQVEIDYDADVMDWWQDHPMNPESKAYVKEISSPEPVVTLSSGDSIQQAIAFLPWKGGTIKLEPGTYPPFRIIGRSNIHILGPEQGEAVITGRSMLAVHIEALDYGHWNYLTANRPKPLEWQYRSKHLWEVHKNPIRNFYFKNIVFDGLNDVKGSAMSIKRVSDVIFDNCTFRNYVMPDGGHPGLVNGHMGLDNIWFRDCYFAGDSIFVTYLDGAHGCGFVNCTILAENFRGSSFLFLTNHDYTYDLNENGKIERNEERNAKYIVMYGNVYHGETGSFIQITGENIAVLHNICTGNIVRMAGVHEPGQIAHFSYPYGAINTYILNNAVAGDVTEAILTQGVPKSKMEELKGLPEKDRYTIRVNKMANDPPKVLVEKQ